MSPQRAGISLDQVRSVLLERGVRPSAQLPAPVSMAVTRVQFWGTKQIDGVDQPFALDQAFEPGLWCVTSSRNLAGKSTVLNVVLAAIRGQLQLSATVRGWMEGFHVELMLDGKPLVVEAETRSTTVSGRAVHAGREVAAFSNAADMEAAMSEFFLEQFSLAPQPYWDKGQESARAMGWGTYSGALFIPEDEPKALLGTEVIGQRPAAILQLFVGIPWGPTRAQARVALNAHRAATAPLSARAPRPT